LVVETKTWTFTSIIRRYQISLPFLKGVSIIRVYIGPISETVYIDKQSEQPPLIIEHSYNTISCFRPLPVPPFAILHVELTRVSDSNKWLVSNVPTPIIRRYQISLPFLKGVSIIRVYIGPISETVYIDIIWSTIIER
jgi:hypothetical protein